jgi:hypothetical protein
MKGAIFNSKTFFMAIQKNRKSEAQELFEQAENAGRFAGNDNDARGAREHAVKHPSGYKFLQGRKG